MPEYDARFDDVAAKLGDIIATTADAKDLYHALKALAELRDRARAAVPGLVKSLGSPAQIEAKLMAVCMLGPHAITAERQLLTIINQQPKWNETCNSALRALAAIHASSAEDIALEVIDRAAKGAPNHRQDLVLEYVYKDIGPRMPDASVEAVIEKLRSPQHLNKTPILMALIGIGPHAKRCLHDLFAMDHAQTDSLRRELILNAIGSVGREDSLAKDYLTELARHGADGINRVAEQALNKFISHK